MFFVISEEPAGFTLLGYSNSSGYANKLAAEERKADCIAPERVRVIDGLDESTIRALPTCYGLGANPEAGLAFVRCLAAHIASL